VRADPLIENLDIEVDAGRVVVHETLQVPGRPELYACERHGITDVTTYREVL
jgi:NADH dehydrogenase FAD-containing subunit